MMQENIPQKTTLHDLSENLSVSVNHHPAKFRFIRAFGVTFLIVINLTLFHLVGKILGAEWENSRMSAVYGRNAQRLKRLLLSLQGIFIKAGQLISILSNFLPDYFRKELEALQDKIPSRPLPEITGRIRQELGADPAQLFAEFDTTPIASASLAQVHLARLHDGRQVAVKVQYVGIEAIARQDLRTIKGLLSFYGFFLRIKGLGNVHSQFSEMINEELDFRLEAQHIETIAANFTGNPHVLFPKVIHELSSERVLTTEYMHGVSIADLDKLSELNIDRQALAERVVTAYCQMIFVDGIYHADPHPGNILVQPDGNIVFVDFGAVARLSNEVREGIVQFVQGILRRDNEQVSAALQMMGLIALHENTYSIEQFMDYLYGRFLKQMTVESWNLSDIHVDMQDKLDMMIDFSKMDISLRELMATFQIPKDLILLVRTLLLLLGLCTQLSPTMNPLKTVRPYLEEFVFGKDKNWLKLVESTIKDIALSVVTIPADVQAVLTRVNRGELEVKVKGLTESTRLVYALGHQLLYGMFVMFFGGLGYWAYSNDDSVFSNWMFGTGGFFALILGFSLLSARRWQKRR
ncbi:MAG TPA: AarF/ABC1/UbiB kinase family protein [Anaerolineae bacterium]|nr:AarF/ABC1/UbiB kinase family protein [Anaerolineae bacterium]HQI85164.1 AarF/ABC1/UbiB kinase family protein [Anaerolineae bacterium]